MSGVLPERIKRCVGAASCGSVLLKRLFSPVAPANMDLAVCGSACVYAESADRDHKRPRYVRVSAHWHSLCGSLSDPMQKK